MVRPLNTKFLRPHVFLALVVWSYGYGHNVFFKGYVVGPPFHQPPQSPKLTAPPPTLPPATEAPFVDLRHFGHCKNVCHHNAWQRYYMELHAWMKYMCLHFNLYCNSVPPTTATNVITKQTVRCIQQCSSLWCPPATKLVAAPRPAATTVRTTTHPCFCNAVLFPACCIKNRRVRTRIGTRVSTKVSTRVSTSVSTSTPPIIVQALQNLGETFERGLFGRRPTTVKP